MIRSLLRFAFKLGLTAGVGAVVSKVLDRRRTASTDWSSNEPWPPIPTPVEEEPALVATPAPAGKATATPTSKGTPSSGASSTNAARAGGGTRWVEPDDEGGCAVSHPVKAKLSSGLFHLPGMSAYERTHADRCYPDAGAAEADGLRQAKR